MRQRPFRPDAAVTQAFNDGVVSISWVWAGSSGAMPVKHPERKIVLPYAERRMGIARYYDALQAQARVDRVLRVPDPGEVVASNGTTETRGRVNTQDLAVTEDGRQYEIELVQTVPDVFPKCLDLTLRAIEPIYEEERVPNS